MTVQPQQKIYVSTFLTAFVLALVLSGLIALVFVGQVQRDHDRAESRLFVCQQINLLKTAQVEDIDRRLTSSRDFLRNHPQGIPGIGRDLIVKGIRDTERLKRRLAPIDCAHFAHGI